MARRCSRNSTVPNAAVLPGLTILTAAGNLHIDTTFRVWPRANRLVIMGLALGQQAAEKLDSANLTLIVEDMNSPEGADRDDNMSSSSIVCSPSPRDFPYMVSATYSFFRERS